MSKLPYKKYDSLSAIITSNKTILFAEFSAASMYIYSPIENSYTEINEIFHDKGSKLLLVGKKRNYCLYKNFIYYQSNDLQDQSK